MVEENELKLDILEIETVLQFYRKSVSFCVYFGQVLGVRGVSSVTVNEFIEIYNTPERFVEKIKLEDILKALK